ncbi:hypothetical protein JCM10207_008840 [Rhodosporidiobolus poonsookiae]
MAPSSQQDAASPSREGDYDAVRQSIIGILKQPEYDDGSAGPILVRLAWHASGTYDKETNTGGSNGAGMRYECEGGDPANAGLEHARLFLEPIKQAHPWITYADLWTLAGVVAVKALGGPECEWKPGRTDFVDESKCPPRGRLPDGALAQDHLRAVFYRMGFNDQEIVALAGAHSLGRCHSDRSGFHGAWSVTPTRFSTQFFRMLVRFKWEEKVWEGPVQYKNEDLGEELMMLPTDMSLISDPEFRKWVEIYAEDRDRFFDDFAKVFAKLLELGVDRSGSYESAPTFSKQAGEKKEAEAKAKM